MTRRWLEFWRGYCRWKGGGESGRVRLEILDRIDMEFVIPGSPGVADSDTIFAALGD